MGPSTPKHSVVHRIRQSPPLDNVQPINDAWIRGKTVIITGGASGFGEGFFTKWAKAGATVVIGDINVQKGDALVRRIKKETGNENLHFVHCDVADWQSQVQLFKKAVQVSPHGGIDTVVANAGIVEPDEHIEVPEGLDGPQPAAPDLKVLNVNLIGVIYTTHLALFYLPRNPGSVPASPDCDPTKLERDRHLVLVSSSAGVYPIPSRTLYGTSKHGVVGLYRNLRATSFRHGVRTNLLCPYFIETPLITAEGRIFLAGTPIGKPEDVVEAATRFTADPRVVGRALFVGPKMNVKQEGDGTWALIEDESNKSEGKRAIFEVYADDFEDTESFTRNMIGIINGLAALMGWFGWFANIFAAIRYKLGL